MELRTRLSLLTTPLRTFLISSFHKTEFFVPEPYFSLSYISSDLHPIPIPQLSHHSLNLQYPSSLLSPSSSLFPQSSLSSLLPLTSILTNNNNLATISTSIIPPPYLYFRIPARSISSSVGRLFAASSTLPFPTKS